VEPEEHNRYQRHLSLPEIGLEGQEKFKRARVLVIGAGGLGCPVLQYLAAAGIGELGIVDFDSVELSNLQRQILFSTHDIGKPKAAVAAQRIKELNPFVQTQPLVLRIDAENALDLIKEYDVVVDGSDNFKTRYLVNDACVILNKPLVFGSVYKSEGQVSVFNYQHGPSYRCLYPQPGNLGSCEEVGVLGVLPGTAGCLMAAEVLKIVSGTGTVLSGTLLLYDAWKGSFKSFSFAAVPENLALTHILPFTETCNTSFREITPAELLQMQINKEDFDLIDVREQKEYEAFHLSGLLIPLNTLVDNLFKLPKNKLLVIHCQSGKRSEKALQLLSEHGYTQIAHLAGGLNAWLAEKQKL
jgi:molybdopterin/thiamine biosynthesis adenylyltransferase/rhodanese-related sulfurtransferase